MSQSYRKSFMRSVINSLTVLLVIFFAVFSGLLVIRNYGESLKTEEQLQAIAEQQERIREEDRVSRAKSKEYSQMRMKTNRSFYEKLADGSDVNILIVGDSIAFGSGTSSKKYSWANTLRDEIADRYNVDVNLCNVSLSANTSYAGYGCIMALEDNVEYDLAVLCYGQNDSAKNFGLYYESIIRALKNRYPKASAICILESSQKEYTPKMQAIKDIAAHYGMPVADTIAPFQDDYDILVADKIHPNDDGHRVYMETVMDIIEPLVEERHKHDSYDGNVIDERVKVFDSFKLLPVEDFTRTGNTFTLSTKQTGTVLGIDYCYYFGDNKCKIFIDGKEYAAPEVYLKYDRSYRHILVINDWINGETVDVKNEIRVVFDEDSGMRQADGFNGLIIS